MTPKIFESFHIYHYEEVSSTNGKALDLIDRGISNETVIIADKQTEGKGRTGKNWISPQGNFYASFIIDLLKIPAPGPSITYRDSELGVAARLGIIPIRDAEIQCWNDRENLSKLTGLTFVTALAVGNTLLPFINDSNVQYKWPNDVFVNGKKISGILLEKKSNSNWLVIGIGVNIDHAPLSGATCINKLLPLSVASVTDTEIQTQVPASCARMTLQNTYLLRELITSFNNLRRQWILNGFCTIREMWLKRAFKMNEQISVKFASKLHEGIFIDIDKGGRLVLQQKDGSLIYFNAGELFVDNTL
ncbi:biotin--[acetyl-CoA-carboxylase] ligase [Wolbachia endosymbiont of Litomosoides brasiliensis]|uniref:biotin--[acetyl-CoA-carboxylase] ligase n=1 Tax=Wolbachia endosymbiont of Litomosoides brasiliensis TaxID=1812117 RepID=UPI0015885400|nr:biotin--[acetyl-CoA-carboxylase] ligase [Wolbachia endosymbiont of Litomosoides brasiliensis]NUY39206.1 biotin--[acetyl-CoA-carboxylase] ligase [Wolbachia endosymbiont of Litomosoides brasiliensis]